jgi:hypothetical protein
VGSFVLLQRASDERPKLQQGLPNEAPHFKALATFTGLLYKKYSQVEGLRSKEGGRERGREGEREGGRERGKHHAGKLLLKLILRPHT